MLLNKYSPNQQRATKGFTIVELLIVIVVIAVLSGIVIVAFNGVRQRAVDASISSDLRNAANLIEGDNVTTGTYPLSAAAANGGQGIKISGNNKLLYARIDSSFCIVGRETSTSNTFYYDGREGQVKSGTCGPIVYTVAGSGSLGDTDGTGTTAQFHNPSGVALDSDGVLYILDYHRIRKMTPNGVVSTLAGSPTSGFNNASGSSAQFNLPLGLTVNASGTIYVADYLNHRIREVTPGGAVSTLAGSGTTGTTNANGTSAQFNRPIGIAVNSSGVIYVSDYSNNRIREITPGGDVTTLAGSTQGYNDATGTSAQFNRPYGIAVDSEGTIYVSDCLNHRIRKITPGGVVTTLAGSGTAGTADGNGTAAQFNRPAGLTVDSQGNVYVADELNHLIRKITPNGDVTTLAGSTESYAEGLGTAAAFDNPSGIVVDSMGYLYIADNNSHRIRILAQ